MEFIINLTSKIILRHIPIAQSRSDVLVLPCCSKSEGPFTCLGCGSASLVLRQGKINVYHFAHRQLSPTCSGGGKSARHKAASCSLRSIVHDSCSEASVTGTHNVQYTDSSAQQEYRYDKTKLYSADVAIFHKGVLVSIVEVRVSHATTGDALQSRTAFVGVNNVWEISAAQILGQQTELYTTANMVEVRSLLRYELDECTPVCHRRVREAEELVEIARQQEIYRTTRPCSDCGVLGLDAVMLQAPDTRTGYFCANCCRKCPSCDNYMSMGKNRGAVHHVATGGMSGIKDGPTSDKIRWEKGKIIRFLFLGLCSSGTQSIYRGNAGGRSVFLGLRSSDTLCFLCGKVDYTHSCFRARSYHKAAEHLESIPKWKEINHFRALVAHEWSTWINSLVLKFEFVAAEGLLLNPLAIAEEPVLTELKDVLISRVRASLVLKRLLRKSLPYIRWKLRKKKRINDVQRTYRPLPAVGTTACC